MYAVYTTPISCTTIVASYVFSDDDVLPTKANCGVKIPELLDWTEEADIRPVLHMERVVRVKRYQRVVVLFNDAYIHFCVTATLCPVMYGINYQRSVYRLVVLICSRIE